MPPTTPSKTAPNPHRARSVAVMALTAPGRAAQRAIVQMAERTPPTRDRYVDFLRALAILAVVCGHWLSATIQRTPHGIEVGNVAVATGGGDGA